MSNLATIISEEIANRGPISFARFMELCLYCPVYGYYEAKEDTIGRGGDYLTSVSVGNVFGHLLAWQFADWFLEFDTINSTRSSQESAPPLLRGPVATSDNSPGFHGHKSRTDGREGGKILVPKNERRSSQDQGPDRFSIIEVGAHNGQLAKDILTWLRAERTSLFEKLRYLIVEPSPRRKFWQQVQLADFEEKVIWVSRLADATLPAQSPPGGRVSGIIFSNELLDSFPVHRYGWDAKTREWFELGVTVQDEQFIWTRLSAPGIQFFNRDITEHLPDHFTVESCPAAELWWTEAARLLQHGKLITIDYGFVDEQSRLEKSGDGTISAYRKHQPRPDILANPGEQDLTANVDFQAIQKAGEAAGLRTELLEMQEQFLTKIFARAWNDSNFSSKWTPEKNRQFQTLIHPEHLGRQFRVLVQGK